MHIRQHSQRLLLIRQQRSTENVTQPFVNRASAPDPSWSLLRSPDPLSGTQGACCPLPKNSARAVSPLDLITSSLLFSGTPVSFFYKPRRTRLSTIGDRAFPVAAARVWNGLPHHVTSAPSLAVFRSRLKTHLFRRCFPYAIPLLCLRSDTLVIVGHINRFFFTYFTYNYACMTTLLAITLTS